MKIRKIWIKGYKQFKDFELDLTNPQTGEALNKVCFIGQNGTGKSTLLEFIVDFLIHISSPDIDNRFRHACAIEFSFEKLNFIYFVSYTCDDQGNEKSNKCILAESITGIPDWFHYVNNASNDELSLIHQKYSQPIWILNGKNIYKAIEFDNDSSDLLLYSPSEGLQNSYLNINDVPKTDLDNALGLSHSFPFYHAVSSETVQEFWNLLIYSIRNRQQEQENFELAEENINKTKRELIAEFQAGSPQILVKLAEIWNKILAQAGLYFDAAGARKPYQLTDNLYAYIKTIDTDERIEYNQLSMGIRNFIFRIGHIYSLYFNREIKKGIVLIDEPENSLFPDFLYDLIETYQAVMVDKNGENNSQLFVATHSPIIAAQFEPYERIVLEWDEPGCVKAHKGTAPAGDDPNDILKKDFGIAHLMGKKGEEMWQQYLLKKKKLRHSTDEAEKEKLIGAITKLGADYNF
ncbi:MAG: ATP-binding protein [Taibaiella sp.]|nr:ATP-binding protein [Taibaiella sp.]